MTQDEESHVAYAIKDLFERIERKLDDFHRDLNHKANQTDFDELDRRLDRVERWQWKVMGAVALVLVMFPVFTAVLVYLLSQHHP